MWDQSPIPVPVDTSVSGLLNRTFKIYAKHLLVFWLLLAIVQTPLTFIDMSLANWIDQQQTDSRGVLDKLPTNGDMTPEQAQQVIGAFEQQLSGFGVLIVVGIIGAYATLFLVTAPLTYIASESYQGRSASIGEAFTTTGKKLKVLFGGYTLYGIIVLVVNVALCFILYACGLGIGLAIFVACAAGFFLVPILLLEDKTVTAALGRSWRLGKRRIWMLIGLWFATFIVTFVVALLFGPIIGLIATVLVGPILPIAFTLLYHDTRAKFEPNGVEVAADARLLTNDDILNLAILCVGSLVVALLIGGLWYAGGGAAMLGGL